VLPARRQPTAAHSISPGNWAIDTEAGNDLAAHRRGKRLRPSKNNRSPRRISIITPEEFEDHLTARESVILNELARLLKLEQSSRQETAALETQLANLATWRKPISISFEPRS